MHLRIQNEMARLNDQCPNLIGMLATMPIQVEPFCEISPTPMDILLRQLKIACSDNPKLLSKFLNILKLNPEINKKLEQAEYYSEFEFRSTYNNNFYTPATHLEKVKTNEGRTAVIIRWLEKDMVVEPTIHYINHEKYESNRLVKPATLGALYLSDQEIIYIPLKDESLVNSYYQRGMYKIYCGFQSLRSQFSSALTRAIADEPEVVRYLGQQALRLESVKVYNNIEPEIRISSLGTTANSKHQYYILKIEKEKMKPIYYGFFSYKLSHSNFIQSVFEPTSLSARLMAFTGIVPEPKKNGVYYIKTTADLFNFVEKAYFFGFLESATKDFIRINFNLFRPKNIISKNTEQPKIPHHSVKQVQVKNK